ncbi:MAG: JAB domain-containing protein [Bacteroidota bacterium]
MNFKVNEIKVSYKERYPAKSWKKITCSKDGALLLYELWDKDTIALYETFKILLLNNSNKVKGVLELSKGGITGTLVDIRLLFGIVLKSMSVGIILAHCHPSGNMKPSRNDKEITTKIKNAGDLLDIKLLDHIILAPDGSYYSFADSGLL